MYSNLLGARWWAPVCLGLSSWTHGQCTNDCGIGDVAEGEWCLTDLSEDITNGGCNSDPVVFGDGSCATTICGLISTYDADTNGDGVPDSDYRDTDWYLVSQSELAATDIDGNGVVQVQATLVSEFPGVAFIISFQPDCNNLGFPGTTGYSDAGCAGGDPALATLVVANHPSGVVVFVSSGTPDGGGIYDGLECSTGINDYTLLIECLDPSEPGGPICMATGDDPGLDGYLEVCADAYGAWTSPGLSGAGDRFNPVGPLGDQEATYASGLFVFKADTLQRELLSTDLAWQAMIDAISDESLDRQVIGGGSTELDTDGDGVTDTLLSEFNVFGAGVDLTFELDQSVERTVDQYGGISSMVTQTYVITNNLAEPISFELLRVLDGDLIWVGDYGDDSVGTEQASEANAVFITEDGIRETRITVSSLAAAGYFGAKRGIDPDGPGPGPAMGYGTDVQEWDAYGIPEGWHNYIAGIGNDTDGESGSAPGGCEPPCDAHIGLAIPISLVGLGGTSITLEHGYAAPRPIAFEPPQEFESDGMPIIHATGDLDGNGTTDVAVVIPNLDPGQAGWVQVFRNLGVGPSDEWLGLAPNTPIPVGREPSGIALGQFNSNSDAHLDMAVTNAGDNDVWIFLNDGTGEATFLPPSAVVTGTRPSSVVSEHFNPDSFVDLAVTNEGDDEVVLLFGDGEGGFSAVAEGGLRPGFSVGDAPVSMLSDDFDNNDEDDVAGASRGQPAARQEGTVFVLRQLPDGSYIGPDFYQIGMNPTDVASGDLNRDGFSDIVAVNADDDTVTVLINRGDGTFDPPFTLPVGDCPLSVEAVDLDNDGDHDLAVVAEVGAATSPERLVQVLENLTIAEPVPGFAGPVDVGVDADANFVVADDFDEDGLSDLATVNEDAKTGGSVTVLISTTEPSEQLPCPEDCDGSGDAMVDILDFLAALAQWGEVGGSCDMGLGDPGVGINEFLAILGAWGPCP
jgi:hypothetical protein